MLDACVIEGVTRTYNKTTRQHDETPTVKYAGRCKIQSFESYEQTPVGGAHTYTLMRFHLHLPVSATGIAVDDRVRITRSGLDPQLTERTYRVAGEFAKTMATAQRLPIEEVVA